MPRITYFIVFSLMLSAQTVMAQTPTKIRGHVTDATTGDALPFVNVSLVGKMIGATTNDDGEYFIETRERADSVTVSYLGYLPQTLPIKKGVYQQIDFKLQASDVSLEEIVINPGENPAHKIIRKIIDHKTDNNPIKYDGYQYEAYTKIEFDVTNFDREKFNKRRLAKQFQFITDYIDTSATNGKTYLPVFISEAVSDFYYRKSPRRSKEIIHANRISGVENESISQFTGQMYIDNNIYNNFLTIFGREFASPISDFSILTYKFYLTDSLTIDNRRCYHITFQPRRAQELTFTGEMWVNDTTFAIKKMIARIADDANINFVNELLVTIEYDQLPDGNWFQRKEEVFVDFNIAENTTGFFGRKTTTLRNVQTNPEFEPKLFSDKATEETVLEEGALKRDPDYWSEVRHEELTEREQEIYNMVDSIKNVRLFNNIYDMAYMFVNGYYVYRNMEFGPYYTFYSFNEVEGLRFKLGGRTSNDFSTRLMLYGHAAYGTKDERLKYGLGSMYMFSKNPRVACGIEYSHDVEQLGISQNAFMEDNILSSLAKRNPQYKLSMVDAVEGYYEKEWFSGFSNTIRASHRQINESDSIRFEVHNSDAMIPRITTTELSLNTRLAYNEKFLYGEFERVSIGTDFPIVNLDIVWGLPETFGSDYQYWKFIVNVSHSFNINPLGRFTYKAEAGQIFGTVPYPLLRLHEGNETYAFDDYAFNMMNYYEFASDKYASLLLEHHFNGFFLNKLPLLRKLKLREVVYGKGVIGSLNDRNNPYVSSGLLDFPYTLTTNFKEPYYEAGVGIENLLKIFRLDAIWRLSYLDHPNIQTFGLRAKMQFVF